MSKHTFNHDAEDIEQAVGLSNKELQDRINEVVKKNGEDGSRSKNIEAISNEFTTVELAFMLDTVLGIARKLKQELSMAVMFLNSTEEKVISEEE